MHISYKFGLFLIFIINISFYHIRAAPVSNGTKTYDDNYPDDYEDDYYDDSSETKQSSSELKSTSTPITTTKTTSFIFNLFDIRQRSNHVVEPTCPKACICLEDYKFIQCSNAGLKQVPHDIPTTAVIIDLSNNEIKKIKKTDFSHRSKLQEINLNYNVIEDLDLDIFKDLPRLQRLKLTNNLLASIHPDTFMGATDLSLLDLSNNSIHLNKEGSFLNLPSLLELNCRNCSWSELYDDTFKNTSSLTALRIDLNDFKKKINTRAFIPLKNLIKLRLPELDANSTEELCNLLKFIDNIGFKHFDVSCYELVLGASYNDSLISATDPPFRTPQLEPELEEEIKRKTKTDTEEVASATKASSAKDKEHKAKQHSHESNNMSYNNTTAILEPTEVVLQAGAAPTKDDDTEKPYQVPISQEAINYMLIGLMITSVIGIIIGIICRKDVGGIKTKCCRTKKSVDEKQNAEAGSPGEAIPLNKIT